jgi:hypothetical protein
VALEQAGSRVEVVASCFASFAFGLDHQRPCHFVLPEVQIRYLGHLGRIRVDKEGAVLNYYLIVVAAVAGSSTIAYAFNGRVSQFQIDAAPGAEAKCTFTVHPRGNQYGWSNT